MFNTVFFLIWCPDEVVIVSISFHFALQVKSDVRRLKGIPALVSMLDNPNREVGLLTFFVASSSFFTEVCFDWNIPG